MSETTHSLFSKVDAFGSVDDDEELEKFFEEALTQVESNLSYNHEYATNAGVDDSMSVDEVLDIENVDSVQVRARAFENPRVTVWLKECPVWDNDAWNDTIYPNGMNAYNGKVHTYFDVRPY